MLRLLFVLAVAGVLSQEEDDQEPSYNLPTGEIQDYVYIGGLFDRSNSSEEVAFLAAVEYVNSHQLIVGKTLVPVLRTVSKYNSFHVEKTFCELAEQGVTAILGPQSPATSHHVQSLCDTLEIPHLTTSWDPNQRRSSCLVNLHPHPNTLTKAITDIVQAWKWEGFTVLYDNYEALMKIQGLVKLADDKGYLVAVRQLVHQPEYGYRSVLQDIKFSEERNLVIECSVDILYDVLNEAQQVGLMGVEYSYIISNLDFQTIDHMPFKWGRTNITSMRLVDPGGEYVREVTASWGTFQEQSSRVQRQVAGDEYDDYETEFNTTAVPASGDPPPAAPTTSIIPDVESSLVHDAVILFAKSLNHFGPVPVEPLPCYEPSTSFKYGYSLVNYMHLSEVEGMSGRVRFDHEGYRSDMELAIEELTVHGPRLKGTWNGTLSLVMAEPGVVYPDDGEDLRNISFTVLIALTKPYNMLKEDTKPLFGNDRYEGFGVDLIHELSQMSGFNYTFKAHTNGDSGNPTTLPNGTRAWDGMIGEVLAGRADLAIADITITNERLKDADFTDPFMNLGITILHRKPTKAPPSLLSFMSPFSREVWAYMMSAYVGVSLLLFVMARVSPYEWTNPYPCVEDPVVLENQFSLNNSFWFTVGSLMQQGSDVAPISASTRMVASIWWFFTLIMVSSYTAQLASFLTVENPVQPFKDIKGLADHDIIKYGAKDGGTTAHFFRDSKDPIYRKIHKVMNATPSVMTTGNEDGVNRVVQRKDYAFFMESTSIEYEVNRKCDLAMIGDLLDHKGYGIVMRQNSTYRKVLSKHIVQLQEKGKLAVMKERWWKEKRGGGDCSGETKPAEASELSLANTGGVFVVLAAGCIFGILVAICEVLWDIYQRENKISYMDELIEELKFVLKCRTGAKPVRNPSLHGSNDVIRKQSFSKQSTLSQGL